MSGLTYNIHAQNIPDRIKLFAHLEKLNPPAVVVMDDVKTARDIKALLPNATVIYRFNGDGGDGDLHLKISPVDWLNKLQAKVADNRIMLYTTNEPGLSKQLVDWHCALVRAANERGIALCVMNLATGNPSPEGWDVAKPLLELLATHRQHIWGAHEYFGGVVTSGIQGGNPTLIMPGMWPAKVVLTRWHLGRFKFLLEYCNANSIKHPRIGITEHGADDTSDIKAYLSTLKKTPPYTDIRGYRTLENQWRDWYGGMGWTRGRTYGEMLTWADSAIYKDSPVEFQAVFCWGHSSADWIPFDVAEEVDYQDFIVRYAAQEASPMPMQKPANAGDRTSVKLTDAPQGEINIRVGAGEEYRSVGVIRNGERFDIYRTPPVSDRKGKKWLYASVPGVTGETWVCEVRDGIFAPVNGNPAPLPVPPPAPGANDSAYLAYRERETARGLNPMDYASWLQYLDITDDEPARPHEPAPDFAMIFRQHKEFYAARIAEKRAELEPALKELHDITNKVDAIQKQIAAYEMLTTDFDLIEAYIKKIA